MDTLYIIDIDGVVYNFLEAFLDYANSVIGSAVGTGQILQPGFENFPCWDGWTPADWIDLFHEFEDNGGYEALQKIPGVQKAVCELYDREGMVIFLTARAYRFALSTTGRLIIDKIPYDLIHFAQHDKAAFIREAQYKGAFRRIVMVEDQGRNIVPCSPFIDKGYLIQWPHNSSVELPPNIERVSGWKEIIEKEPK